MVVDFSYSFVSYSFDCRAVWPERRAGRPRGADGRALALHQLARTEDGLTTNKDDEIAFVHMIAQDAQMSEIN